MFWFGLDKLGLWLARHLMAVWIKVTVLPETMDGLGLDPAKPVFYVLESRSLANLLVLEKTCLEHSLPQPSAPLVWPDLRLPRSVAALQHRRGRGYAPVLGELIGHDVQLVPVSIFWGRSPGKEHGFFKLLFADTWERVGGLRKFFTVLLHGRNTWLQFGAPMAMSGFGTEAKLPERKLGRVLRVHFRHQRSAAIGPQLSHPHSLIEQLLRARDVRLAINEEALDKNISERRALARARRYAYEIAAAPSYPFLLFMRRALRRLWDRLYDGVEIGHLDALQRAAPGHTVVYLPCHRSHIDYLLLSYVLFTHGLAVPHIAAGINLNIPLIGPWLRRGGAFFIRRSFKGNPLYAAVFHQYLSINLAKGAPVEYFVEGGRSRTGRSLLPKPGMLDMTVRSFLVNPDKPFVLIPVYIGYEKLVEGRSYIAELSGRAKQKETLFGFFKGLRALRSRFGKVHLNICEPLYLEEFLDHHRREWRAQKYILAQRPNWLPPVINDLGSEVMTRINAGAALNPINLLALILLATRQHAMAEGELKQSLAFYLALAKAMPYSRWTTQTPLDAAQIIEHGLALGAIERLTHPLGNILRVPDDGDSAYLLAYFRNNIVHVFALPAIVACCFQNARSLPLKQVIALLRQVYPFIRAELFLRWRDEEIEVAVRRAVSALTDQGLLERSGDELWRRSLSSAAGMRLTLLAECVIHTFERYYITATLLLKEGAQRIDQEQLEELCQFMAQRLSLLYAFRAPEFFDKTLFRRFLQTLRDMRLLWDDEQGRLDFDHSLLLGYRDARVLLSAQVRHSILQLIRDMPESRSDDPVDYSDAAIRARRQTRRVS